MHAVMFGTCLLTSMGLYCSKVIPVQETPSINCVNKSASQHLTWLVQIAGAFFLAVFFFFLALS